MNETTILSTTTVVGDNGVADATLHPNSVAGTESGELSVLAC